MFLVGVAGRATEPHHADLTRAPVHWLRVQEYLVSSPRIPRDFQPCGLDLRVRRLLLLLS
jgi:hypothetical protein